MGLGWSWFIFWPYKRRHFCIADHMARGWAGCGCSRWCGQGHISAGWCVYELRNSFSVMLIPRSPKLFTHATRAPLMWTEVCVIFLSCSSALEGAFSAVIPFQVTFNKGATGVQWSSQQESHGFYSHWGTDFFVCLHVAPVYVCVFSPGTSSYSPQTWIGETDDWNFKSHICSNQTLSV